jgi:ethanolamine utilization protein EutQ (cupin superfamily)
MTRKLDAADFSRVTETQTAYRTVTAQIAKCTIDESLLTDQLELIRTEKQQALQQFKDLQLREERLVAEFREKYGEGEINIEAGTFTPYDSAAE